MQAKFPVRPAHQAITQRAAAPPANDISCDDVVKAVRSFPRGAAPGPSGMRPDFLKQLVDAGDEQHGAQVLIDLVNLLDDGLMDGPPSRCVLTSVGLVAQLWKS